MKIIITEHQLKMLLQNENVIIDKLTSLKKNVENIIHGNVKMYKEIIPRVSTKYYGTNPIKEDAFRHILASAFFATTIGEKLTWFAGQGVEILGALRSFLKGDGFDSGWAMDTLNNQIGIDLGMKNPTMDVYQLAVKVKKIVDSGDFYTANKILYKNDKNPKK
jgi:hypothetical protein